MRNVRTIILAAVSRWDLCYVSENEGFRFWEAKQKQHIIWSVICPRSLLPGKCPSDPTSTCAGGQDGVSSQANSLKTMAPAQDPKPLEMLGKNKNH